MDSAKKSVEKILEIAKKHGYDCVVAFKKGDDGYVGIHSMIEENNYLFSSAFRESLKAIRGGEIDLYPSAKCDQTTDATISCGEAKDGE